MSRFFALLGLVLFALSLVGAIRSRLLASKLGGLAQQFRIHHWLGIGAVLCIGLHILWETLLIPTQLLVSTLILSSDPGLVGGWLAMLFLLIAFVGSFWRSLPFKIWRAVHLLYPVSFVFAMIHFLLFMREESLDRGVIFSVLMVVLISMLVMILAYYWAPGSHSFRVFGKREYSPGTWELTLEPLDRKRSQGRFKAGQLVYVRFLDSAFTHALHPFSVASCRLEPQLRLLIKSLGRDTSHMQELPLATTIQVVGPFDEFRLAADRSQFWIAGGIGVAPFLGFLACRSYQKFPAIGLLHFISRSEDGIRDDEWKATTDQLGAFRYKSSVVAKGKKPDLLEIDSMLEEIHPTQFLICGPPAFMKYIRRYLHGKGVPSNQIFTEEFNP
jgi:predicted ferric reductase